MMALQPGQGVGGQQAGQVAQGGQQQAGAGGGQAGGGFPGLPDLNAFFATLGQVPQGASLLTLLQPQTAFTLAEWATTISALKAAAGATTVSRVATSHAFSTVNVATGGGYGASGVVLQQAVQVTVIPRADPPMPLSQRLQTVLIDGFGALQNLRANEGGILKAADFVQSNEGLIRTSWTLRGMSPQEVTTVKTLADNWLAVKDAIDKRGKWDQTTTDVAGLKQGLPGQVQQEAQGYLDNNLAAQVQAAIGQAQLPNQAQQAINAGVANLFGDNNWIANTFKPSVDTALDGLLGDGAPLNLLDTMKWAQSIGPKLRGLDGPFGNIESAFTNLQNTLSLVGGSLDNALAAIRNRGIGGTLNGPWTDILSRMNNLASIVTRITTDITPPNAAALWADLRDLAREAGGVASNLQAVMREINGIVSELDNALGQVRTAISALTTQAGNVKNALAFGTPGSVRDLLGKIPAAPLAGAQLP